MQSKPGRNSPTPEIGLKCFLTQQSGAISSKTTLKDSTPFIFVFIHVACASLLLGMGRHLQQHELARLIQMLKMVPPNETTQQPLASPRAWYPGPGTGTWRLVATSDVPAKDAYDAQPLQRLLHLSNGYTSLSQYCPSTPDWLPASPRTANQWPKCA